MKKIAGYLESNHNGYLAFLDKPNIWLAVHYIHISGKMKISFR